MFWPVACNIKVSLLGLLLHNGAEFVLVANRKELITKLQSEPH